MEFRVTQICLLASKNVLGVKLNNVEWVLAWQPHSRDRKIITDNSVFMWQRKRVGILKALVIQIVPV